MRQKIAGLSIIKVAGNSSEGIFSSGRTANEHHVPELGMSGRRVAFPCFLPAKEKDNVMEKSLSSLW